MTAILWVGAMVISDIIVEIDDWMRIRMCGNGETGIQKSPSLYTGGTRIYTAASRRMG